MRGGEEAASGTQFICLMRVKLLTISRPKTTTALNLILSIENTGNIKMDLHLCFNFSEIKIYRRTCTTTGKP